MPRIRPTSHEEGWFAGGDPLNRALASRPTATVAGDIDGELQGDAVVAYFSTNEVSVFLWDDKVDNYSAVGGTPMNITGSGPIDPVIFDLDGVAPLDVAVATNAGFEVFAGITPDSANHAVYPNGYYIDDMVGVRVGGVDLLMVALNGFGEVTTYRLYEGDSDATEIAFASVLGPAHIAVGDFDADGADDDVIIAAENGTLWLSTDLLELGPEPGGSPLEADPPQMIGTFEGAPRGLAVGQLDGVCGDDVALITHTGAPDQDDDDVIVLRNDGDELVDPIGLAHFGSYVVKIADLDGDDVDEIIIGGGPGDVRIVRYMP